MAKKLQAKKEKKDLSAKEHRRRAFINTAMPKTASERKKIALAGELEPEDLDRKLRDKISEQ